MEEQRYRVLIDGIAYADNMNIETATILIKALFEKYYNDNFVLSVQKMESGINSYAEKVKSLGTEEYDY